MMNLKDLNWDVDILQEFGIKKEILPEIRKSSDYYGNLCIAGLEHVSINGVIGDQQAAALAMGIVSEQKNGIKVTLGSGVFILISTGTKLVFTKGLLTTVLYADSEKVHYGLEGSIEVGGLQITFFENQLKMPVWKIDEEFQKKPFKGNEIYVSSFGRVMAPYWKNNKGGIYANITMLSNMQCFWRAFLESVCFRIKQCLSLIALGEYEVLFDGGMTKNAYLMQFCADLLQKELKVMEVRDQTLCGSALASGL